MTRRRRAPYNALMLRTKPGLAFAALRSLRGWSLEEAAQHAGLSVAAQADAERGELPDDVTAALASLYGLGARDIEEDFATPDETSAFTVFMLHNAQPGFDLADMAAFGRAMQSARIYNALAGAAHAGASLRRRFSPLPPARPMPRDAAQQGYQLARRVRAELDLPAAPLGDMRALLEERFGVPVVVEALLTYDLRAASALDADRACASVLLADDDERRATNPLLTRVYLAHELCHLLFDPSQPGRVQIALDDHSQGRAVGKNALLESRAKGFAAEFLLPLAGLREHLAERQTPATTADDARELVRLAASHFRAPWEISARHLGNLGFIDKGFVDQLLYESRSRRPLDGAGTSTLPQPGAAPICIQSVPAALAEWARVDPRASQPPAFVGRSYERAAEVRRLYGAALVADARREADAGRPIAATDLLVELLDTLLLGGDVQFAQAVLDAINPDHLPPQVLTGVLSLTAHARDALGESRSGFVKRVMTALDRTWKLPADRRQKIAARLG